MANKNMSLEKTKMPEQAPDVRNKNFEEVALGYTAEMAVEEANRCLGCKNMPCVIGCPVNVQIPQFIAPLCLPSAAVSAPRRTSAKASASAASRARALPSAVWSVSAPTGTWSTAPKSPRRFLPTAIRLLFWAPALLA